jgi:hypothetical protein
MNLLITKLYPVHISPLIRQNIKVMNLLIMKLYPVHISPLIRQNILLGTFSLMSLIYRYFFLKVRNHVSHPSKRTHKSILLHILIFMLLDTT